MHEIEGENPIGKVLVIIVVFLMLTLMQLKVDYLPASLSYAVDKNHGPRSHCSGVRVVTDRQIGATAFSPCFMVEKKSNIVTQYLLNITCKLYENSTYISSYTHLQYNPS